MRSALFGSPGRAALTVAVIALALRLVVLATLFEDRPYYSDETQYFQEAERIAAGQWLGTTTFYAPGVVYFMAVGLRMGLDLQGLRVAQALLGAAAAALVVLLGSHLFGLRIGLLAGLGTSVYPYLLYLPGVFYAQNMAIPLMLLVPYALYRRQGGGGAAWTLTAGAAFALAGCFVVPILVLTPFLALWHLAETRGWRARGRDLVLLTLAGAFVLTPVLLRNARLTGRFVPVASMGGRALYYANNPDIDPLDRDSRHWIEVNVIRVQQEQQRRGWTEAQTDSALSERARQYILADPGRFLQAYATRLGTLWGFMPRTFTDNEHTGARVRIAAAVTSAPVLLLGLGGAIFFVGRWRLLFPLYLTPLLLSLVLSVFHTTVRYRLTFEPYLFMLAAAVLVRLLRPRAVGGYLGHGLAARFADPQSS